MLLKVTLITITLTLTQTDDLSCTEKKLDIKEENANINPTQNPPTLTSANNPPPSNILHQPPTQTGKRANTGSLGGRIMCSSVTTDLHRRKSKD